LEGGRRLNLAWSQGRLPGESSKPRWEARQAEEREECCRQREWYGWMEQNREPRNKPRHLGLILRQRRQDYKMGKNSLSASGAGKTGQLHVNQ